jgi:hypothetical protein
VLLATCRYICSGFAAIPPTWPTAVSQKRSNFWRRAPCHARPRRRRNSAALAMPGPKVVECIQAVGLTCIMFTMVGVSVPHTFLGVS